MSPSREHRAGSVTDTPMCLPEKIVYETDADRAIEGYEAGALDRRGRRMKTIVTGAALRDLQALFGAGAVGGLSDGQLLERFIARGDGAAFEAIVRRHGPIVWGVCRRVLRDHH